MYAGKHAGAGAPAAWPSAPRASSYTTKQVPLAGTLRVSAGPKPRYRPCAHALRPQRLHAPGTPQSEAGRVVG